MSQQLLIYLASRGLTNLKKLVLFRSAITDDGIQELTGLTSLHLKEAQITDEGIKRLTNITSLNLEHEITNITNRGLLSLPLLTDLDIYENTFLINDESIQQLTSLLRLSVPSRFSFGN
jgi:hypothetical protein